MITFPLLIFYTKFLKKLPLIGNIIIGTITAMLFLFTEASLTNKINIMWIPFLLASLLSIIRELCKDIEDFKGDYKNNITTFPVKFGQSKSIYLLRFISISFSFFAIYLWLIDYYGHLYLILIILGILLPLLYNIFFTIHISSTKNDFSNLSKMLKILSGLGILIIFVSEFTLIN
jgi:4-hydroxybenzoate polyprenyltransferase